MDFGAAHLCEHAAGAQQPGSAVRSITGCASVAFERYTAHLQSMRQAPCSVGKSGRDRRRDRTTPSATAFRLRCLLTWSAEYSQSAANEPKSPTMAHGPPGRFLLCASPPPSAGPFRDLGLGRLGSRLLPSLCLPRNGWLPLPAMALQCAAHWAQQQARRKNEADFKCKVACNNLTTWNIYQMIRLLSCRPGASCAACPNPA